MIREVRIPCPDWSQVVGARAVIPVKVVWLELQLTEDQIFANAVALAAGRERPYPDHSIFQVVVERP